MHSWPLIDVPGVLDKLTEKYRWVHFVFYFVVWQSSLSDSRQSKFGWNLAGGNTEISDFGAEVNSRAPLNYSVFTRQVQLGRSTKSGGITYLNLCLIEDMEWQLRKRILFDFKKLGSINFTESLKIMAQESCTENRTWPFNFSSQIFLKHFCSNI